MGFGNIQGRGRTDPSAPRALAVCDYCGFWYSHNDLVKQLDFFGPRLAWTGYLACPTCRYTPNEQLKPIHLPADPVPIADPRPEYPSQDFGLQGFTQYTLTPTVPPQTSKTTVLATIATLSGVATPAVVTDNSGSVATASTAQTLVAANAARVWLAIYNPTVAALGVSLGTAAFGNLNTIMLGPGEALFWANAQGGQTVYTGAMTVVAQLAASPYYAWQA